MITTILTDMIIPTATGMGITTITRTTTSMGGMRTRMNIEHPMNVPSALTHPHPSPR